MVTRFTAVLSALFAAEAKRPLIERLDLRSRIAVLAALLGILLVGFFLVVLVALGGRFVRRFIRRPPRSLPPISGATRDAPSESGSLDT
jgi:predicted PurR-regulated permease PerM